MVAGRAGIHTAPQEIQKFRTLGAEVRMSVMRRVGPARRRGSGARQVAASWVSGAARAAFVSLLLGLAAAGTAQHVDYSAYQRATQNQRQLEAETQRRIEQSRRETQQALAAQRAADAGRGNDDWLRRQGGAGTAAFGGGAGESDSGYASSDEASRRLGRSAPPPAGAQWIRQAQLAWQAGRESEAVAYLERAAGAGSAGATRLVGLSYEQGTGVPRNAAAALGLYRRAAQMGDAEALLDLGRVHALGIGVRADLNQAIDWYTRASRRAGTRERGEQALALVQQLAKLEAEQAEATRCATPGACETAPAGAAAADMRAAARPVWSRLPGSGALADFYFDRASLTLREDLVVVSELVDLPTTATLPTGQRLRSMRFRIEYDCRRRMLRTLAGEAYEGAMGSGAVVSSDSSRSEMSAARAGTPEEAAMNSICSQVKDGAAGATR